MNTVLFFVLGFSYVLLFIWGLVFTKNLGLMNLTNVFLLVIFGLIYDNLILAFGKFIGEGNLLQSLSYVRFWLHALFTPTLILFAWKISYRTDTHWAKKKFWKALANILTIGLIFYELFSSAIGLKLEPTCNHGVLSYESAGQSNSPLMVIIITLVLVIVGFNLIIEYRFFWLFIGTLIIISGAILSIWIKSFPIMNVIEYLFIVSLLLTMHFFVRIRNSFNNIAN